MPQSKCPGFGFERHDRTSLGASGWQRPVQTFLLPLWVVRAISALGTADCFIAFTFTGPSVFGCPLSISQPPIVSVDSPIVPGHKPSYATHSKILPGRTRRPGREEGVVDEIPAQPLARSQSAMASR